MNIGIDIDDVVADSINPLINFYNQRTGGKFSYKDFIFYRLEEVWGGTPEEAIAIVKEFYYSNEFADLPLIEGAEEGLYLLNEKHNLVFVTSRHSEAKKVTPKWIRKKLPELQDKRVIYSGEYQEGSDDSKGNICIREGLDLILEDNGQCALDCSERGITTILFDRPWNTSYSHPKIHRVHSWLEATREIESLNGQI